MRFEETTNVDKSIYTFVRGNKELVDSILTKKLIARGAKEKDVKFEYIDIPSTCCPQIKIVAYAEIINKRRTKNVLDDETNTD